MCQKRYLKKLLTFDTISGEYLKQVYSRTSISRTMLVVSVLIGMNKWIFKIFQIKKIILILVKSPVDFLFFFAFKGIVQRAELCKYDIRLLSRIFWAKRIIPSFKNGDFDIWYSPATFRHNFSLQVYAAPFQWRLLIFIGKNLWRIVLEANKKEVPPKSYSLKIRILSIKSWRTKKKLRKPVTQMYWPELQAERFRVYILLSIM